MKVNLEELPDVGLIHVAAAMADVHIVKLHVSESRGEADTTLVDVSFGSDRHGPTRFKKALEYISELPPRIEYEHYRAHMFGKNTPESGPPRLSVAGERPNAYKDGDIVYPYRRGRTKWTPHQRGGATRCRIVCWDYAYSAMALCSFSDRFCYETGRDIAFERALEQVRVAYANDREGYNAQMEEERQRRWGVRYNTEDLIVGVDLARDELSETKKVKFTLDESAENMLKGIDEHIASLGQVARKAFPHEIFDEGISVRLGEETIERIREAMEKRDMVEGHIYILDGETEFGGRAYNALFGQFRELFNEYLLATGLHPAEKEYLQNNPRIPAWLSDYVELIADEHPVRGLNYWPLEPRLKHVEKIEALVRENVDVLGVDYIPAGKLWLDVAYGLLQDFVELKKPYVKEKTP